MQITLYPRHQKKLILIAQPLIRKLQSTRFTDLNLLKPPLENFKNEKIRQGQIASLLK